MIDALLNDVAFLNDHTQFEMLRVLAVSKCDLLSEEELEGVLIQVHSIAEDKGIDFVTTSAREGDRSIRDVFKYMAQHTTMAEHARARDAGSAADAKKQQDEGQEAPEPMTHRHSHGSFGGVVP